jgi:Pyruvate/2-oxoacid:ferredoxin oxidoreductase delta subunit/flavodoxin
MTKCIIFYFSGTGNTAFAAELYRKYLEEKNIETHLYNIENIKRPDEIPDISGFDWIGTGFPVYSFTIPGIAERFIDMLPEAGDNQKAFAFATFGASGGPAVNDAVKILKKKGYSIIKSPGIKAPDNFVLAYYFMRPGEEKISKILQKTESSVKNAVEKMLAGDKKVYKGGWIFGSIIGATIGRLFKKTGARKTAEQFYVNENCNSCELCAKTCPVKNIEMIEGRPKFLDHCEACYRCFNICPQKAIIHKWAKKIDYRYKCPDFSPGK